MASLSNIKRLLWVRERPTRVTVPLRWFSRPKSSSLDGQCPLTRAGEHLPIMTKAARERPLDFWGLSSKRPLSKWEVETDRPLVEFVLLNFNKNVNCIHRSHSTQNNHGHQRFTVHWAEATLNLLRKGHLRPGHLHPLISQTDLLSFFLPLAAFRGFCHGFPIG